ncbi:NADH-quinone oxidoreductase subunit K [Acuticoccus sp.]|uniref:NADH-quinone oxidoreductase subunit K n=1 Tax=Acuticoccus sp. TaxID=1904378 RepID=UPI003B51D98B
MEPIFCVVVGLFYAASIYLMLSPQLVRILLGISIFGNAVNLTIFTAGRLTEAAPPVLAAPGGQEVEASHADAVTDPTPAVEPIAPIGLALDPLPEAAAAGAFAATANPLPQALILTAIVIAFSFFAFLLVLTFRAYQALGTDAIDAMRVAEPEAARPPAGY